MIDINQPNLDLGEVKLDSDTLFEVKIKNTYMQPKTVVAQPSCGACTYVEGAPDIIPPGQEGVFRFRFHPSSTGTLIKSIFFNIDGKTEQTFLFQAKVS